MVRFTATAKEREIVKAIARRALVAAAKAGLPSHVELEMDIVAAHCNGCPLRLADLLAADDCDFNHDIFGIRRHLDRKTGRLTGCFVPRFRQEPTS